MHDRVDEAVLVRGVGTMMPRPTDDELIEVMCNSLYPGASRASALMVLGYCRAAGLDPMLKPVHIVPMRVKTGQKNDYGDDVHENRDTVLPGIGLYRVRATETGQYAGKDEPEFGPMVELNYERVQRTWVEVPGRDRRQPRDVMTKETLRYPEWCKVTVYRLVGGFRSAFTAVEYWLENYATAGRNTDTPNEMWRKRTRGQLAKCAEAQALRMGFSDAVGNNPTAEEMEGRTFDAEVREAPEFTQPPVQPRRASEVAAQALTDDRAAQAENTLQPAVQQERVAEPAQAAASANKPAASGNSSTGPVDDGTLASVGERKNVMVTATAKRKNLAEILSELGIALDPANELEGMTKAQFKAVKAKL